MPNYGLDPSQRDYEPWGLPGSVLSPGKVITDPVHGDIFLTKLEVAVIDSRPFQRLRGIRQLGNTHLVYPGAVHTRFSHCLGALKVAQTLLEVVWDQSGELHGVEDDLFSEWREKNQGNPDFQQWAKVVVLARLGALLHDLCHVPAGHTVEDDLEILEPHDRNESRFKALWADLSVDVPSRLKQLGVRKGDRKAVGEALLDSQGSLFVELRPLVISKGKSKDKKALDIKDMKYPFCADLVGNTICADLLDYLDRDHLFTGLPESLGRRFVSAFFVTGSERGAFSKRLALNILRDGHERTDIISELLKALRYRYELSERALVHQAKLAADAMLGESIERWEWSLWWRHAKTVVPQQIEGLEAQAEFDIELVPKYRAELEEEAGRSKMSEEAWADTDLGSVRKTVRSEMEEEFVRLGDEGLLDFLVGLRDRADSNGLFQPLLSASAELAADLKNRRLFRIAERVGASDVSPKDIHAHYGDPATRADLEADAQRFAGLGSDPKVILWIPPPDMRLKLAEVLVSQEAGIAPFVTYERSRSRRGSDIYDSHGRLWAAYVFVHRDVGLEQERMVSAYLGRRMGIRWERHRDIGGRTDQWPLRLAVAEEFDLDFESDIDKQIKRHGEALVKLAARMPNGETFDTLRKKVRLVKEQAERSSEA
jgi:hypothetical protein